MSYQIGQIRKTTGTSYMTDVTATETTLKTVGFGSNSFDDFALSGDFNARHTYYLRFRVKRKTDMNMTITLGLYKTRDGSYKNGEYQVIDAFDVSQYVENVTGDYASFEVLFTPDDSYLYLAFVLSRGSNDYLTDNPTVIDDIVWNGGTYGDFAMVNNILPVYSTKIGFQSRPGTLITVNNEPIRLGRSGMYEINNGVEIVSVGVAAPGGDVEPFILDYAYES